MPIELSKLLEIAKAHPVSDEEVFERLRQSQANRTPKITPEMIDRWLYVPPRRLDEYEAEEVPLLPETPPIPGTDGMTWNDVFDWYYRGGIVYFHNLMNMAPVLALSPKTIRNNHSLYLSQFGARPMPDEKSKFAGHYLALIEGQTP